MYIVKRAPIVSVIKAKKIILRPFIKFELRISAKVPVKIGPGTAPPTRPNKNASRSDPIKILVFTYNDY